MLPQSTLDAAASVLQSLRERGWMLATAESCTGGLIAAALTHVAGSSDVFDRGFVTYSNEAKINMLGIARDVIDADGAVSAAVARAMAEGALACSRADIAISVTGIAGPGGGSADKPVGLVWFGCAARRAEPVTLSEVFQGDRASVRALAVAFALSIVQRESTSRGA